MGTAIGVMEFESPINLERSTGIQPVADKARSRMELFLNTDDTGYIEWSVDDLDMYEDIGLTFEIDAHGKRTLVEYDGVMTLPDQAMELCERHGIDVAEMRKSMNI